MVQSLRSREEDLRHEVDARRALPLRRAFLLTAGLLIAGSARAETPSTCASAYESAQLLRQRGKLVDARAAALTCARATCPEVARKDCATWADEVTREIPTVVVAVRDADGRDVGGPRISIDGDLRSDAGAGRALELDPGVHAFRVERAGYATIEERVTVVQGERDRILRFALRANAAPAAAPAEGAPSATAGADQEPALRRSLVPVVVVGGLSAVALGVSAYLGLTGRSDLSHLRATCAPTCTDAQVDPVHTKLLFSDIALAAGLVGAGVTVYLAVRSGEPAPARVTLAPARGGGAVVLDARF
jgi:hypothetical protein